MVIIITGELVSRWQIYGSGAFSAPADNPFTSLQQAPSWVTFWFWPMVHSRGKLHAQGHCNQAGIGIQRAEANELIDQVGKLLFFLAESGKEQCRALEWGPEMENIQLGCSDLAIRTSASLSHLCRLKDFCVLLWVAHWFIFLTHQIFTKHLPSMLWAEALHTLHTSCTLKYSYGPHPVCDGSFKLFF